MLSRFAKQSAQKQFQLLPRVSIRALTGSQIPSANIYFMGSEGPVEVDAKEYFAGKKVALFTIPGAFTPVCQTKHVPGFEAKASEFKALGVEVVCVAPNDVFVNKAFQESTNATNITFISDLNASFSQALGSETTFDATSKSLGIRPHRMSMFVDNGTVQQFFKEAAPSDLSVTDAEQLLSSIKDGIAK